MGARVSGVLIKLGDDRAKLETLNSISLSRLIPGDAQFLPTAIFKALLSPHTDTQRPFETSNGHLK